MASQALMAPAQPLSRSAATKLSPAQSLTVVKIFTNAAVACICHERQLIPRDSPCFRTRYINDLQSEFWKNNSNGYSAFCDGNLVQSAGNSQEFRILKRGEDERADRVLDMIETGVFPGIDGGVLEIVRFFVTKGGIQCFLGDVLESYTLKFGYNHEKGNKRIVSTVSLDSTPIFAADNAIRSFSKAIKSLLASLQGLPPMPGRRRFGVAMLYNASCPSSYGIPGFLTEDLPLAVREQTNWHKLLLQKTGEVGEFEVGPFHVVVGTSNIRPSIEGSTSSRAEDLYVQRELRGLQHSPSGQEHGLLSTLDAPSSDPRHALTVSNLLTSDMISPLPASQNLLRSSASSGSQRGPSDIMATTSRQRNLAPETLAELILKACELETPGQGGPIFNLDDLKGNKITRLNASLGGVVRCGCGSESSARDLLLCILCGTSQHMECYGWKSFKKSLLPDEHLCYTCLLRPREAEIEKQMPTLIHKRLALEHLMEKNPADASALMDAMHLLNTVEDHKIFNDIIDALQQDGYLTRGGSAITAIGKKQVVAKASSSILNPLAQISHHYTPVRDGKGKDSAKRKRDTKAAIKTYAQGRNYLPQESDIADEQQITPRQASKRKASILPAEETPQKRRVGADKVAHHELTRSMDKTPPMDPATSTSVIGKASYCESMACLDDPTQFDFGVIAEDIAKSKDLAEAKRNRRGYRI